MQRYESYKPSGVEWLGDVPEHWDVKPLRSVTTLKADRNRPDLPVLSVYREYGVILKDSRDDNHNATSLDTGTYKVVKPGDLVVNKMKAWQGSMGISAHEGIVSPAYITCSTNPDRVQPNYLHYLLRSAPLIGVYNSLSYGVRVGQWDMHYEDFKQIPIPIPDKVEQNRIVQFLDQKTTEIDTAIAKKKRLIELLQEQKSILINQVVTRGLNPNVPMKDSGVPWIGKVPEHWSVFPMRRISVSLKTGRTPPSSSKFDWFEEGSISWFTPGDFQDNCVFRQTSRLINHRAIKLGHVDSYPPRSIYLIGIGATLGKVCVSEYRASCNQQINVITLQNKHDPSYFAFQLNSFRSAIFNLAEYTTMPILNQAGTRCIPLAIPPNTEQLQIAAFIRTLSDQYEKLILVLQSGIRRLRDIKSLLIEDAVTGKIKV